MAMGRTRSFVIGLLLAAPFYLLLIDTTTTPELIAGALAAVVAGAAYELAYAEGAGHAAYRARWLLRAWRVLAEVPVQILIVCAEVAAQAARPRRRRGCLRAAAFHCGSQRRPTDIGRRALAEAVGSLTPNTIVIGVDPGSGRLLVHQLRRRGGREQLDQLDLGSSAADD